MVTFWANCIDTCFHIDIKLGQCSTYTAWWLCNGKFVTRIYQVPIEGLKCLKGKNIENFHHEILFISANTYDSGNKDMTI